MRMSTWWNWAGFAAALALGAGGCDGGESTTSSTAGRGGAGAGSSTSQGGSGGTGAAGGTGGAGAAGGGVMGGPFSSKGEWSYEAQTSVAADSKGGVVAAWISFFADSSSAIGYAVSRDGGEHWTPAAVVESPGGRLASNPVVTASGKGTFSLVWTGFRADGGPADEHVYVSQLDSETETFPEPAIASDDGSQTKLDFDKPSVEVGADDELLVTYADFTDSANGVPASLVLARSADGKTFQRTVITDDATFGNLASLCLDTSLGAQAPLYVVHLGAGGAVTLRRSDDEGTTWSIKPTPATLALFQDIDCAVHGSDLWITYAAGTAPFVPGHDTPADSVQIMHSANGGDTFDAPVTVSEGAAGEQLLYPRFARTPAGKLAVVYYQGVVDGPAQFVLASSADGKTWSSSPVAPAGTFTTDRTIASWLGGYVGLAATSGKTFTTYGENTENIAHVGFAEIAVP